jgi:TonB family protein
MVIAASFLLPMLPEQWAMPISTPALVESTGAASVASRSTEVEPLLSFDPVRIMVIAYVIGVFALLARLAFGWSWAMRLKRDATPVPDQSFFESALVHVPVTVGLFTPRIVVPHTWRTWPADMLSAVLAHEGAHASRRDGLWLTVALVHRACQWINPLSWWLPRHMAALSERASDDAALTRGVAPTRYAEILLSFANAAATRQGRVAWVVAMARPTGRDTERRLDRVLTWKGRPSMTRARLVILAIVLAVGSAAVYTASLMTDVDTPAIPAETVFVALPPPAAPAPAPAPDGALPQQKMEDPTVVAPVMVRQVHPKYTAAAMRAKIQGTVTLQVTINEAGDVTAAKVTESLDAEHGLDTNAIDAVMQWKFKPGTIGGTPQVFSVEIKVEFRLH